MLFPNHLLLQTEDGIVTEEGAAFAEACRQSNWLASGLQWSWSKVSPDPKGGYFSDPMVPAGIPIGSVEYVSRYLKALGGPPLRAWNVPEALRTQEFLGRQVLEFGNRAAVEAYLAGGGQELLLKPAGTPKRFQATTTRYLAEVPEDEPIFASELLPDRITAEWRAFVYRRQPMDIRPYILDTWVFPDRDLVRKAAGLVQSNACTIDFAVTETGRTVVLEAHPFLACGLYGFSGPGLLRMAKAAWREHFGKQDA